MVERWPANGAEIQVWQLQTAKEKARCIRRDNRRRRRAIVKCTVKRWMGMK